jgi:hypothetical protein
VGVGQNVDARSREDIEVDVAGDAAVRAPEVEVPAAQRRADVLAWIEQEGPGRQQPAPPAAT